MTGAGTVIRMKVNDGKLKCRRNYLQTDSWRSLSAAPSLHAFVRRQGQLRARSAVCPKAEKRLGGEAAFPVAGGGFWKLLKDAASRCIPRPFEHFIETTLRWDGKSFDRFTRVSSETLKNEEEEERGKKDYCQLVIEGIGVLTREIRLWRWGRSGGEDGTKEENS